MKDVLVKDIMSFPLISLDLHASIQSVTELMILKDIGGILISSEEKYVGIITKQNIVQIVSTGKEIKTLQAKDIMTSPLKMVDASKTVFEAAKKLILEDVRRIIVSKEGKPVGMVSERDIVKVAPGIFELLIEEMRIKR